MYENIRVPPPPPPPPLGVAYAKNARLMASPVITPLSTIDERGSKINRNNVFDCYLSPVWRQMAIENTVSIDLLSTFLDGIGVFDCRLPGVVMKKWG